MTKLAEREQQIAELLDEIKQLELELQKSSSSQSVLANTCSIDFEALKQLRAYCNSLEAFVPRVELSEEEEDELAARSEAASQSLRGAFAQRALLEKRLLAADSPHLLTQATRNPMSDGSVNRAIESANQLTKELEEELNVQKQKLQDMTKAQQEAENQCKELQQKLAENAQIFESTADDLKQQLSEVKDELQRTQNKKNETESSLRQAEASQANLEQQVTELEQELVQALTTSEALASAQNSEVANVDNHRAAREEYEARVKELQEQEEKLFAEIDSLKQTIAHKEAALEESQRIIEEMEAERAADIEKAVQQQKHEDQALLQSVHMRLDKIETSQRSTTLTHTVPSTTAEYPSPESVAPESVGQSTSPKSLTPLQTRESADANRIAVLEKTVHQLQEAMRKRQHKSDRQKPSPRQKTSDRHRKPDPLQPSSPHGNHWPTYYVSDENQSFSRRPNGSPSRQYPATPSTPHFSAGQALLIAQIESLQQQLQDRDQALMYANEEKAQLSRKAEAALRDVEAHVQVLTSTVLQRQRFSNNSAQLSETYANSQQLSMMIPQSNDTVQQLHFTPHAPPEQRTVQAYYVDNTKYADNTKNAQVADNSFTMHDNQRGDNQRRDVPSDPYDETGEYCGSSRRPVTKSRRDLYSPSHSQSPSHLLSSQHLDIKHQEEMYQTDLDDHESIPESQVSAVTATLRMSQLQHSPQTRQGRLRPPPQQQDALPNVNLPTTRGARQEKISSASIDSRPSRTAPQIQATIESDACSVDSFNHHPTSTRHKSNDPSTKHVNGDSAAAAVRAARAAAETASSMISRHRKAQSTTHSYSESGTSRAHRFSTVSSAGSNMIRRDRVSSFHDPFGELELSDNISLKSAPVHLPRSNY